MKFFYIKRWVFCPCWMYKIIFFLVDLFWACFLAWTKGRLVTKHVLSITYFHSYFFLTFPLNTFLKKIFSSPTKIFYTFICRYETILKEHSSKFPKSPNVHFYRGFGNGAESGRTLLVFRNIRLSKILVFMINIIYIASCISYGELIKPTYIFIILYQIILINPS